MASCDICGSLSSMQAIVEGAEMNVCARCSRFGKVVNVVQVQKRATGTSGTLGSRAELEVVRGYGKAIQAGREAHSWTREELAKRLNMREADLLHFEEEKFKPSDREAKKLEAVLKVKLLEPNQEAEPEKKLVMKRELTLGDVVVIKDKRGKNI